jgi:hypothetical protein
MVGNYHVVAAQLVVSRVVQSPIQSVGRWVGVIDSGLFEFITALFWEKSSKRQKPEERPVSTPMFQSRNFDDPV